MIVLHALWHCIDVFAENTGHSSPSSTSNKRNPAAKAPHLLIWAEHSNTTPDANDAPKPKRSKKTAPQTLHPFALTPSALSTQLAELTDSLTLSQAEIVMTTLRLPTLHNQVLASPELLLAPPDAPPEATLTLAEWTLPALAFEARWANDILLALPNQPADDDVRYGASLIYWAEVAKLAQEIIVGQRFAPALRNGFARWEPVFTEHDIARLTLLTGAMPPLCRALCPSQTPFAPLNEATRPDFILPNYVNAAIDAFARGKLQVAKIKARKDNDLKDQFLAALTELDASKAKFEPSQAATSLQIWLTKLRAVNTSPFRTCFRLEAPETDDDVDADADDTAAPPIQTNDMTWLLSYHLQANHDRSLLVPAEQVWQAEGGMLTFLKHQFENPQERLLEDLGRASSLFPSIDISLNQAQPTHLALSTTQAYDFLRQSAAALEQSGFGVQLPVWWQKPTAKVGAKLKIKSKAKTSTGLMGMNAVVDYDWQVAIGDETLSLKEFEKLAALKVALIQVRGKWVELKPEEIEKAIHFFKHHRNGETTLGTALNMGLGGDISESGLPIVDIDASGEIKTFFEQLSDAGKIPLVAVPSSLQATLRPYQQRGLSWLAFLRQHGMGACLADDMGLGKTMQLLALLLLTRTAKPADAKPRKRNAEAGLAPLANKPVLLICPMSIVGNWQREAAKFAPSLRVMVHHGADRLDGNAFVEHANTHDLVLSTYALAQRDEQVFGLVDWDMMVLDEAQNIKNIEAKQTQAIRRIKSDYRIALTGTPVENRLSELWSIIDFLNGGYLGSQTAFGKNYAQPIEKYRDEDKSKALKRLIQPFVLRRVKTDKSIIADLPDKLEMKVMCNLLREQATLYEAVVKDMMQKIEDSEGQDRRFLVLATLMKLKQVCNHPAHFLKDGSALANRSGKLARLEEMLDEALAAGDKSLVFTQFSEMGELLQAHLQRRFGREALFLHGGVPKIKRDDMVQRFQTEPKAAPIFILSLKAGGVGLNLTAANHVFHFDRWWNPAVENQATDRAFRIGQQKNVQVHKYICVGTLEEKIDMMIDRKRELSDIIVGADESWLTELNNINLRDLFNLSKDAVGD